MTVLDKNIIWKQTPALWSFIALASVLMLILFNEGLQWLVHIWGASEQYSYGYMVPLVALFFVWQKKEILQHVPFSGAPSGFAIVVAGVLLLVLGDLSALYIIVQYAFLIVLTGLVIALLGWRAFRVISPALLLLVFMIPLPDFLLKNLSSHLQLLSSQLGVAFIKLFGISVYLEGNVIDLGSMKLQVIEACSGLTYLFPLMTFGYIAAYLFKAPLWKRSLIFLSTIPITVLMNSFRVGMIGITVEYWGRSMAEGFLHDFEGWLVFMACTVVLFLEMWLLARIGNPQARFSDVFAIDFPAPTPKNTAVKYRPMPRPFLSATIALVIVTLITLMLPERRDIELPRRSFSSFPMLIGSWHGTEQGIEQNYLDVLKLDDYLMADYTSRDHSLPVNLYIAYYKSQQKGASVHSPRSCIPGGGWDIMDLSMRDITNVNINGTPLHVNRAIIQKGEYQQLVYYWFQQRGRIITNEYLAKWYLFWDSITRHRTDGALIRLIYPIPPGMKVNEADQVLTDFAAKVEPILPSYIPD